MLGVEKNSTYRIQSAFGKYLNSHAFLEFAKRYIPEPGRWNLIARYRRRNVINLMRTAYKELVTNGQLLLSAVLMANSTLDQPGNVAPALLMGTFDFTPEGYEKLFRDMQVFQKYRESPVSSRECEYVRAVYGDQQFQFFRKRPVSDRLALEGNYVLYDELLRSENLVEIEPNVPFPFVASLALPGMERKHVSAVLPLEIMWDALQLVDPSKQT